MSADHFLSQMRRNIEDLEKTQKVFAERTRAYEARFPGDPGTAEIAARNDRQRENSVADGQYYQSLAVMYGIAAVAEMLREAR